MARNTVHGAKVPFYKTWWFWVIIILFIYGFVSGMNKDDEDEAADEETSESSSVNDIFDEGACADALEAAVIKNIEEIL